MVIKNSGSCRFDGMSTRNVCGIFFWSKNQYEKRSEVKMGGQWEKVLTSRSLKLLNHANYNNNSNPFYKTDNIPIAIFN